MIRISNLLSIKDEVGGIKTYLQSFKIWQFSQLKVASLAKNYIQKKEQTEKGKAAHSVFSHK